MLKNPAESRQAIDGGEERRKTNMGTDTFTCYQAPTVYPLPIIPHRDLDDGSSQHALWCGITPSVAVVVAAFAIV